MDTEPTAPPDDEDPPRWVTEEASDADLEAAADGVEDCDHNADDDEGMEGVDLPDNLAATEDYGDDGDDLDIDGDGEPPDGEPDTGPDPDVEEE